MEKITLTIKDYKKKNFLLELLTQFDFVEVEKDKKKSTYDFFSSSGLWKNRDINADQLREQAWKRNQ